MDGTARLANPAASPYAVALLAPLYVLGVPAAVGCGASDSPPPATAVDHAAPADAPQTAPSPSSPSPEGAAPTSAAPAAPVADGAWPFLSAAGAEDRDALLERLRKDPGPIKSNWVPPGKADRYGHAEGLISAPVDAVRAKLRDFGHYKDLAGPKFKSVKVVDKQGQSTDVYFQLPIMKGLVTIWYVTRFPPARAAGDGDVLEGTFVKGNIKGMHIAFTVRPGMDESNSVLICDLILRPNIPAPQSALDEELRDACGDAINSLRKTIAANP